MPLSEFPDGFTGHIVAVGVMVAESAEGEMMEDVEVAKLGAGAATDIAREQADPDVGSAGKVVKQRPDAGKQLGRRRQLLGQVPQIGIQDGVFRGGSGGKPMGLHKVADDRPVGAARQRNAVHRPRDTVKFGHGPLQRLQAGAGRRKQRSVDVEKYNEARIVHVGLA